MDTRIKVGCRRQKKKRRRRRKLGKVKERKRIHNAKTSLPHCIPVYNIMVDCIKTYEIGI